MKKVICLVIIGLIAFKGLSQYDISAINYGIVVIKNLGLANEAGIGVRMEYAPNCYTTYMGEYNRLFSIGAEEEIEGYNELALGVNLILFNWYPTTITAGMGYIGNDSNSFEMIEDEAFLGFRTGGFNHGAQIKIRALHQVSAPVHIFAEFNLKSLGRRYDAVLIGFSYDFEAR